jgi:hypothetical protein
MNDRDLAHEKDMRELSRQQLQDEFFDIVIDFEECNHYPDDVAEDQYDDGYNAYWNGTPLQEQEPLPWQQGWRDAQSDDEMVDLAEDYDAN